MKKSIDNLLFESNLAVEASIQNDEIRKAVALYGYSLDKLEKGKALVEKAMKLKDKQQKEKGEKIGSSQDLQEQKEELNKIYMTHIKISRVVFKNDLGAFETLELNGERKRSNAAWLLQIKNFYSCLKNNKSFQKSLLEFGVDQAKLDDAIAKTWKVEQAMVEFKKETGEAQQATVIRDDALERLEDWYGDFRAIARIALEDSPQMLEALGIVVKG